MKERVPPGLADNEISPLDNHNADKEAGVAGEFDDFPLLVGLPGGSTAQPVTRVSFRVHTRQQNDHSILRATLTFQDHQNAAAEVFRTLIYLLRHELKFRLVHVPKPEEPHKRSPIVSPTMSGVKTL